jgi:hypothetical protein
MDEAEQRLIDAGNPIGLKWRRSFVVVVVNKYSRSSPITRHLTGSVGRSCPAISLFCSGLRINCALACLRVYMKDVHGGWNADKSAFPRGTRRRRLGRWLRALAGTCLSATVAGAPAMVAGGIAAGAPALILAPAPSGPSFLLSAGAAAPKFCLAAAADDLQVHLTWVPSASGKDLAIYDGTASDSSKAAKVGTAAGTSALVTGLTNDTTYYFWLVDAKVSNVVSNMASATPGGDTGGTRRPVR